MEKASHEGNVFYLEQCQSVVFVIERCISVRLRQGIEEIGSLSIDDANGSENVGFKMISRFFNRFCVYSLLLKMASVSEFSWS